MSRPHSDGFAREFDARALLAGPRQRIRSTADRFWARLNKNASPPAHRPELGPCWLWTGSVYHEGYGRLTWCGVDVQAHRVAYSLEHGAIQAGVVVRHHCDTPACCRPSHLVLGTIAQNNEDARERGRARVDQLYAHHEASRGSGNVNAKLNDALVAQLRRAYAAGETCKSIVDRTGLSVGTVHPMLKGRTWAHVPMPFAGRQEHATDARARRQSEAPAAPAAQVSR